MKILKNNLFSFPFAPTEAAGRVEGSERSYPSTRTTVLHRDERLLVIIALLSLFTSLTTHAIFDYDLAIMQSQKGNWLESTHRLNKILADHPDNPDILYDSGVSAYKNTEFDKALAYFNKSAESANAPQILREQAYFNAGNAHVSLKQLQEAIDAYNKVLALNPDHEKAKHNKEIVKKMLEEQKKEQEQKDKEQEKEKENKDQQEDQKKDKDDQKEQEQKKDSDQKQKNEKEKEQKQDQEKKDQQRKEKEKKEQEQQKKEKAEQQEKQKNESADQRQQPQEPKQKNESEQKLSAALEHALKEREKKDAQLNKKMIKAMAESQNGGKNGSNCW